MLLKLAMQTFTLVSETETFGKVDAQYVDEFRSKLSQVFPHATLFKTREQIDAETDALLKSLSLNSVSDVNEKLNGLNIK